MLFFKSRELATGLDLIDCTTYKAHHPIPEVRLTVCYAPLPSCKHRNLVAHMVVNLHDLFAVAKRVQSADVML